jgi:hypothetical protein
MPNEPYRQTLARIDREYLVPKFSMETVTRNWAATIVNVFHR